jgi:OmpA-OmpF porin, OOP family
MNRLLRGAAAFTVLLGTSVASLAQASDPVAVVEISGKERITAEAVTKALFPDDDCLAAEASGNRCMGFAPAKRFVMPANSFAPGSAELPAFIRTQLDAVAEAMRGRTNRKQAIRLEGHADATGSAAFNEALSQRRADAAKEYLVAKGVSADMLIAMGRGSAAPKLPNNPFAAENRRVEIARDKPPGSN